MEVTTKEIDFIKSKYPELNGTEDKVITIYEDLQEVDSELWELRQKVHKLEEEKKELFNKWNILNTLYNIQYKTKEINEINNSTNMRIINPSDYRNK